MVKNISGFIFDIETANFIKIPRHILGIHILHAGPIFVMTYTMNH